MARVAVDATPLVGHRSGVGNFVAETLGAVGRLRELAQGPAARLSWRGYGLTWRGRAALGAALPPWVTPVQRPMPARALMSLWHRGDFPVVEYWTGPIDVVHGTNFVVPPTQRAVRVVTVHDLSCIRYPELCSRTTLSYPALLRRALDSGATVHTPSRAVADEVVELVGADRSVVRVIPLGVRVPPEVTRVEAKAESAGPPYILAIGTAEPRKDLPGLVRAFDLVAPQIAEIELRLVGQPGWGDGELVSAIAESPFKDRIHRLGWVDDVEGLLRGAAVLAYPSRYEGFGLPPLEAMARGVPVVASSVPAVVETVGDAALLVGVGDPTGLAAGLISVLEDQGLRTRLIDAGRQRAGGFGWEATARSLCELYLELVGERRRL